MARWAPTLLLVASVATGISLFILIMFYPSAVVTLADSTPVEIVLWIVGELLFLTVSLMIFRLFWLPPARRVALTGFWFTIWMVGLTAGTPFVVGKLDIQLPDWKLLAEFAEPGIGAVVVVVAGIFAMIEFAKLYHRIELSEQETGRSI